MENIQHDPNHYIWLSFFCFELPPYFTTAFDFQNIRTNHTFLPHELSTNCLLSSCHYGFRPRSSTQQALLSVTNDWHLMLSKHRQVASIFFDVKKAFDSVPHDKLIQSLAHIGVCGPLLQWLTNYLQNRHQLVVLDGESSSLVSVSSGVPQGSILGRLLFINFMNSISDLPLSSGAELVLYADDILLTKP